MRQSVPVLPRAAAVVRAEDYLERNDGNRVHQVRVLPKETPRLESTKEWFRLPAAWWSMTVA